MNTIKVGLEGCTLVNSETNEIICSFDNILKTRKDAILIEKRIPNTDCVISGYIDYNGIAISEFSFYNNGTYHFINLNNSNLDEIVNKCSNILNNEVLNNKKTI